MRGEWTKTKLGDLCTFISGGTPKMDEKEYWNGTIPFVSAASMHETYIDNTNQKISESGLINGSKLLKQGNLLLLVRGSMLWKAIPVCYNNRDVAFNQDVKGLILNENVVNQFLLYWLKSKEPHIKYMVTGTGLGAGKLDTNDLQQFPIYTSGKDEQLKIAHLFARLDERIATQNKIIERYESLIRGIVDTIILRKPQNAIIGDVCMISKQIRAESKIDDIITVRLHGNGVCKSNAESLQLGATQYYRRKAGQLIYGKQNFHNGAIGIIPKALDKGITSKDIPSFDIDNCKCNSTYLLAQLLSPKFYKPSEALTTGTGSKRLKEETFLKMPIVLPDKEEQDNIAVLIDKITMRLDQAKRMLYLFSAQKQYLLRQMFI